MDSIRRLVQMLRLAARSAEHDTGLSGAQVFVLQQLAERPANSLGDLANRTLTHQSSVSVVVQRLLRKGLVHRTAAKDDGRRIELRLTPRGRALARKAPEVPQAMLIRALDSLPSATRRTLRSGLAQWLGKAGAARLAPNLFFEDNTR